jgi:sugar lactone lactonase YvrE
VTVLVHRHSEQTDHGAGARHAAEIAASSESDGANPLFSFTGHAGGLGVDRNGTIWVSDRTSATIWRVTGDGTATSLVAATAEARHGERSTSLSVPAGLALSPDGSLFVADSARHRVCAVSPDGTLRVVAGVGAIGYRDGPATEAMFRFPLDVAIAPDGTCYVADTDNDRIRAVSTNGMVSTIAGSIYDYGDGRGPHARFRRPGALDIDAHGTCYVADTGNNAIRRITPDGEVTTLAGAPPGGDRDGNGGNVGLRWPTGIAAADDGSVWVADHGNGSVRHITAAGKSRTPLKLSGLRWPTVVAMHGTSRVVVAGVALADGHVPETYLMILGGSH